MNHAESIRVAIVEDHAILREELSHFMRSQGLVVHELSSGAPLGPLLDKEELDLVVLDVNLPGEDGFAIAGRIKQRAPHLGVLMLSARSSLGDKVTGYDSGADIYLPKPVEPEELMAAVRSLLRRVPDVSRAAKWKLDARLARLIGPGGTDAAVPLTLTEVALLRALVQAPSHMLSAEELCGAVSPAPDEDGVSRRALENLVSRLRKKVSECTQEPDISIIRSVRNVGYQLGFPIEMMRRPALPSPHTEDRP